MKSLSLPSINKNQLLYWFKTISITGLAQVIVQGVGFATGILIIRLLPTQEYALYTLANTMLGTMTMLADGGISAGVMSESGKVWQDKEKLGIILATGLDMRKRFAIVSLIITIPILLYLLLHNHASWITATMICLSLIPAFYASLSDTLLEIPLKLHQSILPLQKNQVGVGVGRLILSSLTLFVFPWSFIALMANSIPRIYGNIKLRKISNGFVNFNYKPSKDIRNDIYKSVKRILPNTIYQSLAGQLTIWLLSIFGNTTNVAQIGALGRISIVISILGAVINQTLVPRFVRIKTNKKLLLKRYLQINSLLLLFSALLFILVNFFSSNVLWILGTNYNDLNKELILSFLASIITLFHGVSYVLCTQRGWILRPIISISIDFFAITIGIIMFKVSSLTGMLYFNIFVASILFIQNICFSFYNILKQKKQC